MNVRGVFVDLALYGERRLSPCDSLRSCALLLRVVNLGLKRARLLVVPDRQRRPIGHKRSIGDHFPVLQVHSLELEAQLHDIVNHVIRVLWSGDILNNPILWNIELANLR